MTSKIVSHAWISVADKLPDTQKMVLLHAPYSQRGPVDYGFLDFADRLFKVAYNMGPPIWGVLDQPVTHWMPLPKPPYAAPAMEKPADEPRKEVQNGPDIPRADVVTGEPRIRDHAAAEDASAADADDILCARLELRAGYNPRHPNAVQLYVDVDAKLHCEAAAAIRELRAELQHETWQADIEFKRAEAAEAERDRLREELARATGAPK